MHKVVRSCLNLSNDNKENEATWSNIINKHINDGWWLENTNYSETSIVSGEGMFTTITRYGTMVFIFSK